MKQCILASNRASLSFAAGALTLLLACAPVAAQQRSGPARAAQASGATLLQVSAQADGVQIEPITRVVNGRLVDVVDTGRGPLNKQLAGGVFKAGRQLAVIFGGGRAGT
jgi:putative cell wall-binding protein